MDIVSNLHGQTYYIDTAVVTPFSANAGLISAASTRPGHMAKREEKKKFDRYPRINLAPFILETTRTTWLPCTKVHQIPIQRHGPHSNSHPRRMGRHHNHTPRLHLQTTTPGGHHVTALPTDSPPSIHPTAYTPSHKSPRDPRYLFLSIIHAFLRGPLAPPFQLFISHLGTQPCSALA